MKTNKFPIAEYDDLEMPSDDMDTDIRNWHSHLVKVRKDTKCVYCGAPISKGDFALKGDKYGHALDDALVSVTGEYEMSQEEAETKF